MRWRLFLGLVCLAVGFPAGCKDDEAGDGGPVITFWTTEGYQPEEVRCLRELASAFEAESGVRVDLQFFEWKEIDSKYLAALAAGQPPNIGQHGPDLPLRFANEGALQAVDDIIEAVGRERFFPEFLDRVCKLNGHYWSVPWFIEVRPLLIRTDWLEALNLDPPATWSEWLEVCKAMTRDTDGDGERDRWGFGLYGNDPRGQNWVAMAAMNGGGLFSEDGAITVDRPENVEALQWYCDLYLEHGVTPPGTRSAHWTDANAYYKRGLVGSLITNGYILKELERDAPDVLANSRFVPMPTPEEGTPSISYLGGSHLMLFKEAPHADAAEMFVRFLLEDERYLRFLKSTHSGALPVLKDIQGADYFQAEPNRRVLVGQIDGGIRHGFRGPPQPAVGAVEGEGVFGRVVQEVITGRKTAAEALRDAEEETRRVFRQHGALD